MTLRLLHLLGSPVLRQHSSEVKAVDDEVRRLVPATNVLEIQVDNPGPGEWFAGLRALRGVDDASAEGPLLRVTLGDLLEHSPAVLGWLRDHGYSCSHLASQRADLETVFLTLTGRSVRNQ